MGPGRAMSGIGRRGGGLALLAALWLAGCAQAPKDLYSWETFARQQHEVLRADGVQSAQQIQDMEAHAQKVRGEGAALPPGFRAHLGMLYLNTGNAEQARANAAAGSLPPLSASQRDAVAALYDRRIREHVHASW